MIYLCWNQNLIWVTLQDLMEANSLIYSRSLLYLAIYCNSVTVLNNYYVTRVSETPLPSLHLECSVAKGISADVPSPMIKTVLSVQEVLIWCLVWDLRSHMQCCAIKQKGRWMEERETERGTKGRRGSVLYKAFRAFTRSDLFISFGKNFLSEMKIAQISLATWSLSS